MAVPKFITNDMKGGYVGGPTTPARRCYVGGTLVYQGFGPASEQEFIQQTAAGGPAQLLKVYGKSIVWNQLMASGDTLSVDNSEGTSDVVRHSVNADRARVPNHKYLCAANFNGQATSDTIIYMGYLSAEVINLIPGPAILSSTASSSEMKFGIYVRVPAGGSIQGTITPVAIDLTLLYGAGHEPTSVAQFLADYPTYDPTYDPGSLQSNKTAELRAYDGGTLRGSLQLNLSTLTGKLNGEGASVVVYPDGLRGVGTDRDAAYGSTGEVARAVVDLGTLVWTLRPDGLFQAYISQIASTTTYDDRNTGYLCSLYSADSQVGIDYNLMHDKTMLRSTKNIFIKDSAYTDPATFKAAMSGVMLDYPLATPLTYTLDTPLPTDLTCEQGDILQRVSDNNCPFVGEMKFGL